jgi:hypothetical protein
MKVAALIALLQTHDADAEVVLHEYDYNEDGLNRVRVVKPVPLRVLSRSDYVWFGLWDDPDPQYAQFDPDVTVSDTPVTGLLLE